MKPDAPAAAPDPEALAEFLRKAPEELREWAAAQLPPEAAEPAPPAEPVVEPVVLTDADLALDELGEVDDEPRRTPKVHTPLDKESTPSPRGPARVAAHSRWSSASC